MNEAVFKKDDEFTPVFKKDDASSVKNYRPISILSAIPKLLEKVMYDQLFDVFKSEFSLNMSASSFGILQPITYWNK